MSDPLEPATLLKVQTALLWPLYHHGFLEGTLSNFMQLLRLLFAEQSLGIVESRSTPLPPSMYKCKIGE